MGWAWLNAKVRLSVGLWGWKEKQALLLKLICHSEYAAAVLHYQCMSRPTATVDSLVYKAQECGLSLLGCVCTCVAIMFLVSFSEMTGLKMNTDKNVKVITKSILLLYHLYIFYLKK